MSDVIKYDPEFIFKLKNYVILDEEQHNIFFNMYKEMNNFNDNKNVNKTIFNNTMKKITFKLL